MGFWYTRDTHAGGTQVYRETESRLRYTGGQKSKAGVFAHRCTGSDPDFRVRTPVWPCVHLSRTCALLPELAYATLVISIPFLPYSLPAPHSLFFLFLFLLLYRRLSLTHSAHQPRVLAHTFCSCTTNAIHRYLLPIRRNDIAEPPSFNFPDLLDITRGCHAVYKRPRINDPLALRERNFLLRNLCALLFGGYDFEFRYLDRRTNATL